MNKMMSTNNVLLKTENGKTHFAVVKMAKAKSELKKKFNFFSLIFIKTFWSLYSNKSEFKIILVHKKAIY